MAGFIPVNYGGKKPPAVEYLPAAAITPKLGLCLGFDANGRLAVSAKPAYICMTEAAAAVTAGTVIPVQKIEDTTIYEAELDGASSFKAGYFVDVASDGLKVDGDGTTNANFCLLTAGTAAGDKVRGRFVLPNGVTGNTGS